MTERRYDIPESELARRISEAVADAREEERRLIARFIQDRLQVDRELHCAARAVAELARRVRDGDF